MNTPGAHLTEKQKSEIVLALVRGEVSLAEICARHRLDPGVVESWMTILHETDSPDVLLEEQQAAPPIAKPLGVVGQGVGDTPRPTAPVGERDRSPAVVLEMRPPRQVPEEEVSEDEASETEPEAGDASPRRRRRRRHRRHRRVHQSTSAAKTSRVVGDWIYALSPILIGLGVGFVVLLLIWLGYFEPSASPPQ